MRRIRAQQTSFEWGELSPSTAANQDANYFFQGARRMKNYIPLPTGSAMRRPGMLFQDFLAGPARLTPYVSKSGQHLLAVFGNKWIRIYDPNTGPIFEGIVSEYLEEDLFDLSLTQIKDRLYIAHENYAAKYLIIDPVLNAIVLKPVAFTTHLTYSNSVSYNIGDVVTSEGYDFICVEETTPGDVPQIAHGPWKTIARVGALGPAIFKNAVTGEYNIPPTWAENINPIQYINRVTGTTAVYTLPDIEKPWITPDGAIPQSILTTEGTGAIITSSILRYVRNTWDSMYSYGSCVIYEGNVWQVKNFKMPTPEEGAPLKTFEICDEMDALTKIPYKRVIEYYVNKEYHPYAFCVKVAPHYNHDYYNFRKVASLDDGDNPAEIKYADGIVAFNVNEYCYTNAGIYKCLVSGTTAVPDWNIPEGAENWALLGPSATELENNYPSVILWHNNRLIVLGTRDFPTTIWGSRVGVYEDFTLGTKATDGLLIDVAGTTGSPLKCGNGDLGLIVGSDQGEMYLTGSSGYLTATDIVVRKESTVGTSRTGMFVSGSSLLFVQRSGNRIYQSSFSNEEKKYNVRDVSKLAEHLFANAKVKQVAVQRTPELIIWVVMTNGKLLSGTHNVNNGFVAWAEHTTQGSFLSVAITPTNGLEDQVFFTVKRADSAGTFYTMEYLDAWDGNIGTDMSVGFESYSLEEGTLRRMEGLTVQSVINNARYGDRVVTNGTIDLDPERILPKLNESDTAFIGLGYDSILTPQVLEPFQTRNKIATRVSSIGLKLRRSAGIEVGVFDFDKINFRKTNEIMGDTVPPFTGEKTITVNSSFTDETWVSVAQRGPTRGEILAISYEIQVGGD